MRPTFYRRYRWPIFVLFVLSAIIIAPAADRAVKSTSNNILDWVPDSFPESRGAWWFYARFGADEMLMVSWEGCAIDDPRMPAMAEQLRDTTIIEGKTTHPFSDVFTSREVYNSMTGEPLELPGPVVAQRMQGWLVGEDYRTCCLLAYPSPQGLRDRKAVVDFVYAAADQVEGLSGDDVKVAGATIEGVAIDQATTDLLVPLTAAGFAISLLIMFACFRSWRLMLAVFSIAFFCNQMSLALVDFSGAHMDSVLLSMPSLVFVLTVSTGVHLANYFADSVKSSGLEGAAAKAVKFGRMPCVVASITTALGLGSLMSGKIIPIQKFGVFSAISVVLSTGVALLFLPAMFEAFPPKRWAENLQAKKSGGNDRVWIGLLGIISKMHWAIVCLAVLLLAGSIYGVTRLETTARLHDLFLRKSRVLHDYEWLEHNIGPLVPVEVVVALPKQQQRDSKRPLIERMQLSQELADAFAQIEGIGCTISAADFGPVLPDPNTPTMRRIVRERVVESQLEQNLREIERSGFLCDTPQFEYWRISARTPAGVDTDYARLMADIRRAGDEIVLQDHAEQFPGAEMMYIGGVPLADKAQKQLLVDLAISFALAFVLIGIAMMLMLTSMSWSVFQQAPSARSFVKLVALGAGAALIAMIPNILPSVAVFGGMAWLGIKVEIGSVLTATTAMGIAVDDTLHFITWYHRGAAAGKDRKGSLLHAYRHCGVAMTQTTLICGLGLLIFSLSPFAPMARFAWLMFTMLSAALICDLVILPALLYGPLGRLFTPSAAEADSQSVPH